jgi:hypothetical protein
MQVNFNTGSDANDYLHGWLNYQIEHHMFPDLSMLSYQVCACLKRRVRGAGGDGCSCVIMRVHERACVHAMHAVHACVHTCVYVRLSECCGIPRKLASTACDPNPQHLKP